MVAALLQCRCEAQHLVAFHIAGSTKVDQGRAPLRQGARLVEHHGVDPVGDFQRQRVLDQDAVTRGHAGAHHDRCGSRQAQRAGAGDDEHRHGIHDGLFPVA